MPTLLENPWESSPVMGTVAQQPNPWESSPVLATVAPDPYQGLLEEAEGVEQERAVQIEAAYQEFDARHNLGERPPELPYTEIPSGMPDVYPPRRTQMPAWNKLSPEEQAAHTKFAEGERQGHLKDEREVEKERLLIEGLSKGTKKRTGQGQARYVAKRLPFWRDLLNIHENIQLDFAVGAVSAGSRDPEDLLVIARAMNDASYEEKRNWGAWVRDSITSLPAYGIELFSTGLAYSGPKAAVQTGVKAVAKTTAVQATKRGLAKIATQRGVSLAASAGKWALPRIAGVAAQTLANPQMIGRNLTARMIPEFKLSDDEAGRLQLIITDERDGFMAALPKAFAETFIEIGAERSGAAVVGGAGKVATPLLSKLPGAARVSALKAAIIRRYLSKPGNTVATMQKILKAGQWHGLIQETLEERVEEIGKGVLGLGDFGESKRIFTDPKQAFYNLSVEAVTLGSVGGSMGALRTATGIANVREMKGKISAAKQRQAGDQVERTAGRDEVAEWVAENPAAARELAALDKPTRTQFESFAPVVKETTARGRVKWVDRVRREIAAQEAQEAAEEPAAPAAPSISAEEKAELFAKVPDLESFNETELREWIVAMSQKRTKAGKPVATTKAETARMEAMTKDQLLHELQGVFTKPKEKVKLVRPEKTGLGKKKAEEKSSIVRNIEADIQTVIDAVPLLKGAVIDEVDAKAGTVKVTRPDGLTTTIHYEADAEANAQEKKTGKKIKGFYVYVTGKKGSLEEGHIYLRKGASHETVNHEVVHWLHDMGVITQVEVDLNGGYEGIAKKYAKWQSENKPPNTLFEKIYDAIEALFSAQKRLFRDIEKRGLGKKKTGLGKKKGGEQDVAFAEEKKPEYIRAKWSEDLDIREELRKHEKKLLDEGRLVGAGRTRKEDKATAKAMLADDYEGTKARLYPSILGGKGQRGPVDQYAVDFISEDLAREDFKNHTPEKGREAKTWIDGNFLGRAELARTLSRPDAMRLSPEDRNKQAIDEAFYRTKKPGVIATIAPKKPGLGLEPGDSAEVAGELAEGYADPQGTAEGKYDKRLEKLRKWLEGQGFDLKDIDAIAKDDLRSLELVRQINAYKANWWDKQHEYWVSMILSGIDTFKRNVLGTVISGGLTTGPERVVEATLNLLVKEKKAAQFGEFRHMVRGLVPGLQRGVKRAVMSFKHEMAGLEWELKAPQKQRQDERGFAIKGKKGKVIRLSLRGMAFGDAMTKSVFYEMDFQARAYRTAKAEGKKGADLDKRMDEILDDPQSKESMAALAYAQEMAFHDEGGKMVRAFKKGISGLRPIFPGVRYFLNFINTNTNIALRSLERTPLGIIPTAIEYAKARSSGDYTRALELSSRLVMWSVIWAMIAGDDDKDPLIIGGEGMERRGKRQAFHRTRDAYTFRLPFTKTRWSYKYLEPISAPLSMAADWWNSFKRGDVSQMPADMRKSLLRQVENKTTLRGMNDMLELMDANSESAAARWSARFTPTWVPFSGFIKTELRKNRPVFAQRRIWGKENEYVGRWLKRMAQGTELPQQVGLLPDQPIYDLWGRPAGLHGPKPETTLPYAIVQRIFRTTAPTEWKMPDIFVGDLILGEYDRTHPKENPHEPLTPEPSYTNPQTKERDFMTDEQYSHFMQYAGTAAKLLVEKHNFDPENPSIEAVKLIGKSIEDSREEARKRFAIQWTGGKAYDKTPEELAAMLHKKYVVAQRRIRTGYGAPQAGKEYQRRREEWRKKRADARAYLTQLGK